MMAANAQTAAFSNKEFQSCTRGVHLFLDVQQGRRGVSAETPFLGSELCSN